MASDGVNIPFEFDDEDALLAVFDKLSKAVDDSLGKDLASALADAEVKTKAWNEQLFKAVQALQNATSNTERLAATERIRGLEEQKQKQIHDAAAKKDEESYKKLIDNLDGLDLKTKAWEEDLKKANKQLREAGTAKERLAAKKLVEETEKAKPKGAIQEAVLKYGGATAQKATEGDYLGAAKSGLGAITGAASSGMDKFMDFANSIAKFVDLIDPSIVTMFNYAVEDLMATVGEAMVPVMQVLVDVMQRFGDLVANMGLEKYYSAMADALQKAADAGLSVIAAMLPLANLMMDNMAKVFEELAKLAEPLGDVLKSLVDAMTPLVELMGGILVDSVKILVPLVASLARQLSETIRVFTPLIELLASGLMDTLNLLMPILELVVKGIENTAKAFQWLAEKAEKFSSLGAKGSKDTGINPFALIPSLIKKGFGDSESDVARVDASKKFDRTRATAKRGITMGSDFAEISRHAMQQAALMGQASESKRTADAAEAMVDLLKRLVQGQGGSVVDDVRDGLKNFFGGNGLPMGGAA